MVPAWANLNFAKFGLVVGKQAEHKGQGALQLSFTSPKFKIYKLTSIREAE